MRWLGTGIGVLGGIALAFGLVGAASAPFRTAGALTVAIGLALVGFDAFARFSVRRRAVGRLRRDLAEAQARGLAAIDRLRLAGLQGEARVVALTDTGASFNQRPELDLELEIHIDGRSPYRVRQRHLVPAGSIGRVQVGAVLPVRVDPELQERMLIEWQPVH